MDSKVSTKSQILNPKQYQNFNFKIQNRFKIGYWSLFDAWNLLFEIFSRSLHLNAGQGSSEARTELYKLILRRSTGADDEVMRQVFWQSFVLCAKAGQNDGGF